MKEIKIQDENRTIRQYKGNEVQLPNDGDQMVEVEYCPTNDLIYIRSKSYYSGKLKRCESVDGLIKRLTLPPMVKMAKRSRDGKEHNTSENISENRSTQHTTATHNNDDEKMPCAFYVDPDTGKVIDLDEVLDLKRSRSIAGLRRTYREIKRKIKSTATPSLSLFLTVTLDSKPDYKKMSKVVADYALLLQRKYDMSFKAGFIFLEPCEDGSWHAHLIVCFTQNIPADFEKDCKKW